MASVALATSCDFDKSGPSAGGDAGGGGTDGNPGDIDGAPGSDAMPDPCESWQPAAPFAPCDIPQGDRDFDLLLDQNGEYTYDTSDGSLQFDGGSPAPLPDTLPCTSVLDDNICLLSVGSMTVASDSKLRVIGDKALLVASWSTINVAGEIDASSTRDGDGVEFDGAGANPGSCPNLDAAANALGPAGGAGGGLSTPGGNSGDGAGAGDDSVTGGVAVDPIKLRGGCPGGQGGPLLAAGDTADGGSGGGAVALSAFDSISVADTSVIQAGGAGGSGGVETVDAVGTGGGGGGSGGLIWLDAPNIGLASGAILAANGGAGGEGGDSDEDGNPGQNAHPAEDPALGGTGGANQGGNGGNGARLDDTQGGGGSNAGGAGGGAGGGGGGGGGLIRFDGDVDDQGAIITPDLG